MLFVNNDGIPVNVQASTIIDGSIIATGSIEGASIAAGTIEAVNIAAGAIGATAIAADAITAGSIAAGAIDGMIINGATINGNQINAADITIEAGAGNTILAYSTAPPAFKQGILNSGAATAVTGTSWAGSTYGATTTAGSAILVTIGIYGTSTDYITGVTDGAGNTYTRVQSEPYSADFCIVYQYLKLNANSIGHASSFTVSYSSGMDGNYMSVNAIELTNVAASSAVDKTAVTTGVGPPVSVSTGTLTVSPELVIGSWMGAATGVWNITDGIFTPAVNNNGGTLTAWAQASSTASLTNSVSHYEAPGYQGIAGALVSLKAGSSPVLLASVSATSGTDIYSNDYQAGVCAYGSDGTYVDLTSIGAGSAEIYLSTGDSSEGDPAIIGTAINGSGTSRTLGLYQQSPVFTGNTDGFGWLQLYSPSENGTTTAAQAELGVQDGTSGSVYAAVSMDAGPSTPFYGVYTSATTAPTNASIVVNSSGQLVTDTIHAITPGSASVIAEPWHNVSASITGWTFQTLRYRYRPDNTVHIQVSAALTSTAASGTVDLFTLPSGYIPAVQYRGCKGGVFMSGGGTVSAGDINDRLYVETSGLVNIRSFPGGSVFTEWDGYWVVPLD